MSDASNFSIRSMDANEWPAVASLIHDSTNAWYESRGYSKIFTNGPQSTLLFCQVYEALDPDCCLVAVDKKSNEVVGSCFYHPRETHVSLGIMNVSPDHFGRGIARCLLQEIINFADTKGHSVRLVSSVMNLDSFSLYNRAGFRPFAIYQDMLLTIPAAGIQAPAPDLVEQVRLAKPADVTGIVDLECKLSGIRREKDYHYFIDNELNIWNTLVIENNNGEIAGFLSAVRHPASNMIGPGVARGPEQALALVYKMLDFHRDNTLVLLAPSNEPQLLNSLYVWGFRNCEIHVAQVYGEAMVPKGIVFPTFMPESG